VGGEDIRRGGLSAVADVPTRQRQFEIHPLLLYLTIRLTLPQSTAAGKWTLKFRKNIVLFYSN